MSKILARFENMTLVAFGSGDSADQQFYFFFSFASCLEVPDT